MKEPLFSYGAGLVVAAAAQVTAQGTAAAPPPEIFWPAFGGAAASALLTAKPAFEGASEKTPRAIGFLVFCTLTIGFLFSFFCSDFLNRVRIADMIGPLNTSPEFAAFACAFAGERVLSFVWSKSPAEWWGFITSIRIGGGK